MMEANAASIVRRKSGGARPPPVPTAETIGEALTCLQVTPLRKSGGSQTTHSHSRITVDPRELSMLAYVLES
jgi:hypothetical protein